MYDISLNSGPNASMREHRVAQSDPSKRSIKPYDRILGDASELGCPLFGAKKPDREVMRRKNLGGSVVEGKRSDCAEHGVGH